MDSLNRREFIRAVLAGQRSDRLPRAIFGGGLWSFRQAGLRIEDLASEPNTFAEKLGTLFAGLDTDIVFAGSGLNSFPAEAIGGHLSFRENQAPLLSHPIIQKAGDARYFEQIAIADSPYSVGLIEMIRGLRKQLPDRFLCATSWGPYTWGMILCDWNVLREKTTSDREFIREVCDLGVRLSQALYGPLSDQGLIDAISVPDGAATLISLDLYREIVLPAEQKLFAWARGRGLHTFFHQCGQIKAQFPLYPDAGADCISVDAGVPIGEVYECYQGRAVTAGNVDVVNTVFGGTREQICAAVEGCVSVVSDPFRNYILMPSCDLPADTPLENVKAFLSCADRYSPAR